MNHVLIKLGISIAGSLLTLCAGAAHVAAQPIDDGRLADAGIRRLEGRRLTLYTDVEPSPAVDGLLDAFDAAYPQWCAYFDLPEETSPAWRMTGYLMSDRRRFDSLGLIPDNVPEFLHGYALGNTLWMYDQPTDYYRRHLLLHEGTHGFMYTRLGGTGSTWYMEGIAERLATHDEQDGRIELAHFPAAWEEVPMLARIKLVQDAVAAGRRLSIDEVRHLPYRAFLQNEAYGWTWALAAFLDTHPAYRQRFQHLKQHVRSPQFDEEFDRLFVADRQHCETEWALFAETLEHRHDLERTTLDFTPGETSISETRAVDVQADLGWQNTGLRLDANQVYEITATGRYQVADEPRVWWCEPGGVTIRYYRGAPLGVLQAAVWNEPEPAAGAKGSPPTVTESQRNVQTAGTFLKPTRIGLGTAVFAPQGGTLFLKINDSSGELLDNAGTLHVEVRRQ